MLVLIVEGKGGNDLVGKKRGKKFRNLDLPPEFLNQNNSDQQNDPTEPEVTGNNELFFDLVVDDEDSDDKNLSII